MQHFPHFTKDETSYITIRLNKGEREHLRQWMHIPEGSRVAFPHGVKLFYRAEGWYRLDVTNTHRAIEKLKTALALVRKWHRDFLEAQKQEERLRVIAQDAKLQVTSYQSDTHNFQVRNKETGVTQPIRKAATINQLNALFSKFGARN